MNEYQCVSGMVQFDPKHGRQVNGQSVSDITIRAFTRGPDGEQPLVGITLWPEFAAIAAVVKKGDTIFADGKIKVETKVQQDASGAQVQRTFISLSPTAIGILSSVIKPPQGVVQAPVAVAPVPVAAPVVAPVQAVAVAPVAAPVAPVGAPVTQAVPTQQTAPF